MAARKVTIRLDVAQLEAIRALVQAGNAESISAFLKHAVRMALSDVAGWQAVLDEALEQTGGPLTLEETRWADRVLLGEDGGSRRSRGRARPRSGRVRCRIHHRERRVHRGSGLARSLCRL